MGSVAGEIPNWIGTLVTLMKNESGRPPWLINRPMLMRRWQLQAIIDAATFL